MIRRERWRRWTAEVRPDATFVSRQSVVIAAGKDSVGLICRAKLVWALQQKYHHQVRPTGPRYRRPWRSHRRRGSGTAGTSLIGARSSSLAAAALKRESDLQVGLIGKPNQIAAVVAAMSGEPPVFVDPA